MSAVIEVLKSKGYTLNPKNNVVVYFPIPTANVDFSDHAVLPYCEGVFEILDRVPSLDGFSVHARDAKKQDVIFGYKKEGEYWRLFITTPHWIAKSEGLDKIPINPLRASKPKPEEKISSTVTAQSAAFA